MGWHPGCQPLNGHFGFRHMTVAVWLVPLVHTQKPLNALTGVGRLFAFLRRSLSALLTKE